MHRNDQISKSGTFQEIPPIKSWKDRTWIWVIVTASVLCVCLAALAVVMGILSYLGRMPTLRIPTGIIPPILIKPTPAQGILPPVPTGESQPGEIIITPYQPAVHETIPTLTELAPGYEGARHPGVNSWDVTVIQDQPLMIYMGWCASTEEILAQNFEHIKFSLEAAGKTVNVEALFTLDQQAQGMQCRSKVGIIQAWPAGVYVIDETMTIDEPINDGMEDYPAGDYKDEFLITVIP